MQDEKQFEQLMLQYSQLKNSAVDIRRMIEHEDFDDAITMLKSREATFLNCKSMRNYLELTPVQKKELDNILEEIRTLETDNIKFLTKSMQEVQKELKTTHKSEKLQQAYDFDESNKGSIVNFEQ